MRQRRFLGLLGIGVVVAIICCAAGTWQIYRFNEKRAANDLLRSNNRHRAVDLVQAFGPVTAPKTTAQKLKFQHVTATGVFDTGDQTLLRGQTINNDIGYVVLTPLETATGTILIARGFIIQDNAADTSPVVPAAPEGTVTVQARIEPASMTADKFGALPPGQVNTVNVAEQSQRLGQAMWDGYAELIPGQPGTAALVAIPDPDMGNPAGGAEEPQHAAYVVQWYIFAILALIAPFVMARMERRRDEEAEPSTNEAPAVPNPADAGASRRRRQKPQGSLDDRLAGRF